ncbi:MAG TPA: hypothetical protein VFR77_03590, partial [Steroidobacteraceae bacterium]|nr:hypothetical protein [Steroidobacteraceae bacterium]
RRRERLYARISDAYAQHHEHRTMRLALAATFVAANPELDPSWQTLVERAHWLWQTHGRDPKAVAARLHRTPDRAALVREIDAALAKDPASRMLKGMLVGTYKQELQLYSTVVTSGDGLTRRT